jgi:MYXO-CTERM domain-containing protein
MDKTTGKLWVGDVGEGNVEEIDIAQAGKHHGYPFREGSKDWKQGFAPADECMGVTPASECIPPVYEYDHGTGQCVIGGRILDGCDWPAVWKSRYIFGDHNSGKIWTVDVNAARDGVVANSRKDFATTHNLTALRMGSDNALYALEESPGRVTRITAKGSTAMPGSCLSVNAEPGIDPGGGAGTAGNGAGGSSAGSAGQATGGTGASTGGATGNAGSSSSTAGSGAVNDSGGATTAGAGSTASKDGGGCGCQVVGTGAMSTLGIGAAVAALGLSIRRRRNQRAH